MDKIKISVLHAAILKADIVRVENDGDVVCASDQTAIVCGSPILGKPDNEVFLIKYGNQLAVHLTEEGLNSAEVKRNKITLEDHEGDTIVIALFSTVPFEIRG